MRQPFAWQERARRRVRGVGSAGPLESCQATLAPQRLAECHETSRIFIPQCETQRGQTLHKRDDGYAVKERILIVAALQAVVRNARAEVVDVVQADVPGEPSQDCGEPEIW